MAPTALSVEVRSVLAEVSIAALLEYVIASVGLGVGDVTLEATFTDGTFRRGWMRRGPMGATQIEGQRTVLPD